MPWCVFLEEDACRHSDGLELWHVGGFRKLWLRVMKRYFSQRNFPFYLRGHGRIGMERDWPARSVGYMRSAVWATLLIVVKTSQSPSSAQHQWWGMIVIKMTPSPVQLSDWHLGLVDGPQVLLHCTTAGCCQSFWLFVSRTCQNRHKFFKGFIF